MCKRTILKTKDKIYKIDLNDNINLNLFKNTNNEYSLYNELFYAIFKNIKCKIETIEDDFLVLSALGNIPLKTIHYFKKYNDKYIIKIPFNECSKVFVRRRPVNKYNFIDNIKLEESINSIEELKEMLS